MCEFESSGTKQSGQKLTLKLKIVPNYPLWRQWKMFSEQYIKYILLFLAYGITISTLTEAMHEAATSIMYHTFIFPAPKNKTSQILWKLSVINRHE
jgi:hypothetical protein